MDAEHEVEVLTHMVDILVLALAPDGDNKQIQELLRTARMQAIDDMEMEKQKRDLD